MRKVLCLFYYFPPTGGVGSLRCAALARDLLPLGWAGVVVAPRKRVYLTENEDLGVPEGVDTIRTPAMTFLRRPLGLLRRSGLSDTALIRLERALLIRETHLEWLLPSRAAGGKALRAGGFQAILSYGAPWSAHLAAMSLSKRHRLPWVASFADEWSTATPSPFPTSWHARLAHRIEGKILRRSSAATAVTATVARRLETAHPGLGKPVEVVANGYDEADFAGRRGSPPAGRFTLLYAGTMAPHTAPFGVLEALGILLARRPGLRARLRWRILGSTLPAFVERARALDLSDVLSTEGPRPHAEAVQAMLEAHALVDAPADTPSIAAAIPVKLFEYLRAGPPVLGFYPPGEAAALLGRFPDCRLVPPGDAGAAGRILEDWMGRWAAGGWTAPAPRSGIEDLSRASQAARLARILDQVSA